MTIHSEIRLLKTYVFTQPGSKADRMPSLASPKIKDSRRSLCSPLPCLSVACVADDGIIQATDYGFATVAGARCGTAPVLAQADQSRVVTSFSHLLGVIHKLYIVYTQSKFTLCRETGYSSYVSSTLPKDGFKPAAFVPVGFFFDISKRPKKKPAIDNDAGFPCLLAPQLMGLDL
jgi:hypothetical protein